MEGTEFPAAPPSRLALRPHLFPGFSQNLLRLSGWGFGVSCFVCRDARLPRKFSNSKGYLLNFV